MLQTYQQAQVARRLYRVIIENTTDLISRHTPEGEFLDASPAAWALLGYWPEQLRGSRTQQLIHPQQRDELMQRYAKALEQDGYLTVSYQIQHRDGHYLWFETASRATRDTYSGNVVEVVSVSRDITERVRSEERTRRLQDELTHATRLAALGELASGSAHELKQPLAGLVSYAGAGAHHRSRPACCRSDQANACLPAQGAAQRPTRESGAAGSGRGEPLRLGSPAAAGRGHPAGCAGPAGCARRSGTGPAGVAQPAAQCHRGQPRDPSGCPFAGGPATEHRAAPGAPQGHRP